MVAITSEVAIAAERAIAIEATVTAGMIIAVDIPIIIRLGFSSVFCRSSARLLELVTFTLGQ
jgi:hypothetical protein